MTARRNYTAETVHKRRMPGVGECGALARLGDKITPLDRMVSCPRCREIVDGRRAAARARNLP